MDICHGLRAVRVLWRGPHAFPPFAVAKNLKDTQVRYGASVGTGLPPVQRSKTLGHTATPGVGAKRRGRSVTQNRASPSSYSSKEARILDSP